MAESGYPGIYVTEDLGWNLGKTEDFGHLLKSFLKVGLMLTKMANIFVKK